MIAAWMASRLHNFIEVMLKFEDLARPCNLLFVLEGCIVTCLRLQELMHPRMRTRCQLGPAIDGLLLILMRPRYVAGLSQDLR